MRRNGRRGRGWRLARLVLGCPISCSQFPKLLAVINSNLLRFRERLQTAQIALVLPRWPFRRIRDTRRKIVIHFRNRFHSRCSPRPARWHRRRGWRYRSGLWTRIGQPIRRFRHRPTLILRRLTDRCRLARRLTAHLFPFLLQLLLELLDFSLLLQLLSLTIAPSNTPIVLASWAGRLCPGWLL